MQEQNKAYVLVQTDPRTHRIAELVRTVPGIVFAQDITGAYDALALAGSDQSGDTLGVILGHIRELPGVIHALPAPLSGASTVLSTADAA